MKYMIETAEELLKYLNDTRTENDTSPFIDKGAILEVEIRDESIKMWICQGYDAKTVHTKKHDNFIFSKDLKFSDILTVLAKNAGFKDVSFHHYTTLKIKDTDE